MTQSTIPVLDQPHIAELLSEFSDLTFTSFDNPGQLQAFVSNANSPLVILDPDIHVSCSQVGRWCVSRGVPALALSSSPRLHDTLTSYAVEVSQKPVDAASLVPLVRRIVAQPWPNLASLFKRRTDQLTKRLKITLIDDSLDDAQAVFTALSEYADVVWSEDPECLPQHTPDLILLDLYFHGENRGLDILERLPSSPPVVVMSSQTNPRSSRRALDLGAAGFIEKGKLSPQHLFTRLACYVSDATV